MKILVTGSSGYIGSRIVPRLLAEGHDVRAGFTNVEKAAAFWWADRCEVIKMDVLDEPTVVSGVAGTDAVLYLVHSMAGDDFAEKDRTAAGTMARACADAGVGRIIYLSGIARASRRLNSPSTSARASKSSVSSPPPECRPCR